MKEMQAEITLAASLPTHNNLVIIYGYCDSPFGVVMSYMPGDSVHKYVYRSYKKKTDAIPTFKEILIILSKAAAGMNHLHAHGLVHRDIACRNILLGAINERKGVVQSTEVRISDFGLTRKLEDKHMDSAGKTQSSFGPLKWMAPESIKSKLYSKKSDVYMFGITMYEIFYGAEPYKNMKAVEIAINIVSKNIRPTDVHKDSKDKRQFPMNEGYAELMKECWQKASKKRPDFEQIMKKLQIVEKNASPHNKVAFKG